MNKLYLLLLYWVWLPVSSRVRLKKQVRTLTKPQKKRQTRLKTRPAKLVSPSCY